MDLLFAGALVGAFVAATLATYAVFPSPAQMYELRRRTAGRAETAAIESGIVKLFWPLLAALAPYMHRIGSASYREAKARDLPLAGLPAIVRVDHFVALKVVMAVLLPFIGAVAFTMFRGPVAFAVLAGLGFYLPDRLLVEMRRAREHQVLRALPSAVDMLTLAVEAGMDFLAALQRVVEKGPSGPLRQEITTIVNDIRLGDTRAGALKAFARRVDIPEVGSFVGVLVQAEKLGASIGGVLRSQADRMRTERFQRAEQAGARAAQKLLVPTIVFIFPAVLLIIISPAAISLARAL